MPWRDHGHVRSRDGQERRLTLLMCGTAASRLAHQDEIASLTERVDGRRLVALLVRMRLLVLVGGRLQQLGLAGIPELERELETYNAAARRWGVANELVALDVLGRLESAGIRAMPLKGSTLARQLHSDVGARTSIDVDILVDPGELSGAVATVEALGWRREPDVRGIGRLPLLHETLVHPALPCVELHWRVHWYEQHFAADALARADRPRSDEPLEMQPLDGLVALMLFYARDGFAGLRFPADAASWWDLRCAGLGGSTAVHFVADRYPALTAPVSVAARLLAQLVGVPAEPAPAVPFRWRVASGLATPFLEDGRRQAQANAGLADLLLAPPSAAPDAIRRVMRNTPGDPSRSVADAPRPWTASVGHALRVARRWALAFPPAIVRGYAMNRDRRAA
jgi:hypothetical protein